MKIPKPHFELTNVYEDGSQDEPQIVPVTELPWELKANRRGFLGAGISLGTLFALNSPLKTLSKKTEDNNGFSENLNRLKTLKAHKGGVNSLAISSDGEMLVSASGKDDIIKIWELPGGKLLNTLSEESPALGYLSVIFSEDGKLIVSGSRDGLVRLWSLPEGELLKSLKEHRGYVYSVCISPDGKILASGALDHTIKLWQLPEEALLKTLSGHLHEVKSVAFSPDGKLLASCSINREIKIWQISDGSLLKTLVSPSDSFLGYFKSLIFSPDGNLLISSLADGTVIMWQMPEGKLFKVLSGHYDAVTSLAFSSDGKLLASASKDKTIKLWRLPDGRLLNTLTGHSYGVDSVAITPDGSFLASGDSRGIIKIWKLPRGEFLSFLFDPSINEEDAITYNRYDERTETTITYTLPCGSPIPTGATCICNCVEGTYVRSKSTPQIKRKNKRCTCVPVCTCQAI